MKAFITVTGKDTTGVIARVAGQCAELGVNVEDVSQSILQGVFAMIMLVNLDNCSSSVEELRSKFQTLADEMEMQITVTRQEVFDAMHKI